MKKGKTTGMAKVGAVTGGTASPARCLAEHVGWDGQERRRHERLKVNWKGVLTGSRWKSGRTVDVQVLNVSEGGCCINLRRSPSDPDSVSVLGAEERLNLNMYAPGAVLSSVVEVRWYVPVHEEVYSAGLEFVAMNFRDRSILESVLRGGPR